MEIHLPGLLEKAFLLSVQLALCLFATHSDRAREPDGVGTATVAAVRTQQDPRPPYLELVPSLVLLPSSAPEARPWLPSI